MKLRAHLTWTLMFIALLAWTTMVTAADGPVPKDERKHTSLQKYATSQGAYEKWKASPEQVKIVDVRTLEEYVFVGHAPMAVNIPSMVWSGKWNQEKKDFPLAPNPDFEAQVLKKFKKDDTIMLMCRSGHRSAAATERLAKAGFTNIYNITDGFEGDVIKDEESVFNGKRAKNGWKNVGTPWTYELKPELVYLPGN